MNCKLIDDDTLSRRKLIWTRLRSTRGQGVPPALIYIALAGAVGYYTITGVNAGAHWVGHKVRCAFHHCEPAPAKPPVPQSPDPADDK